MSVNDEEIISKIVLGEADLYAVLVDEYYPGLQRYLYSLTRDYYTADDLCQETFIKAYQNLQKYNPEFKFSTWLFHIGHNGAIDFLRKKPALPLFDDLPSIEAEPTLNKLDSEQRQAELRQAIMDLPLNYRSVLSLYYWRRLKYEEIAHIHGVPVNTIKTWLRRAKAALKENLHEEF